MSKHATFPTYLMAEISREIGKARIAYPQDDLDNRADAFHQEAGEASQAIIKLKYDRSNPAKLAHARLEVIQCAAMCIRLLTEAL